MTGHTGHVKSHLPATGCLGRADSGTWNKVYSVDGREGQEEGWQDYAREAETAVPSSSGG